MACWASQVGRAADSAPATAFQFTDVGAAMGLFPAIEGIYAHAAGWGDIDGDGQPDLFVATFSNEKRDGKTHRLLRQANGKFEVDSQTALQIAGRATSALFADLDNDGDLDLYVSSMPSPKDNVRGCALFRNDGGGKFTDISPGNEACPEAFGGRSATVVDVDGDGLLDLLVGEEPNAGYNGSKTHSTRLFRNLGDLKFKDVSREAGLPQDMPGLGVAAADVNGDTWPDLFVAAPSDGKQADGKQPGGKNGGNRLLLNDGHGKFQEAACSPATFAWPGSGGDNMVCGATFGDVNGDGRLDLILGPHFKTPWVTPVAPRLFINLGSEGGEPKFEDVTQRVGIEPLALKAPHVEIQDFDNDGLPDVAVSIVKFAGGRAYPIIFRNLGTTGGLPKFKIDGWDVNDFPTAEDRATRRTATFFEKMLKDHKIVYSAPAPAADFDRDGKVDLFHGSWWPENRSMLLRNETPGGHWLRVRVEGGDGVNRMGVGARVLVRAAGDGGIAAKPLLGCREIATGFGYASAQVAEAHFGLGKTEKIDVEVVWPHGKGSTVVRDVAADREIVVKRGK
ncbi:CRTAC1 family protein [Humisphaera borealis]|uniref:CRTAC1 family protein n=1 Tax=Humisphaera borealis TaxID=2807512 RepID=UPI0019CF904C|nr:CRTAC1 family protein [Humisphaera borealis]